MGRGRLPLSAHPTDAGIPRNSGEGIARRLRFFGSGSREKRNICATGPVRVAPATGVLPDLEAAASGLGVRRSGVAERGRQDTVQETQRRDQGLITSTPHSLKSLRFLVARAAPTEWAMAAIWQSAWPMGWPAVRREAAIPA